MKYPRLYDTLTRAAGPLLHVYPDVYRLWSSYEKLKDRLSERSKSTEPSVYHQAAEMLLRRGFDAVVFGHTHHAETIELLPGKQYLNSGNWMHGGTYVQIDDGELSLRRWPAK